LEPLYYFVSPFQAVVQKCALLFSILDTNRVVNIDLALWSVVRDVEKVLEMVLHTTLQRIDLWQEFLNVVNVLLAERNGLRVWGVCHIFAQCLLTMVVRRRAVVVVVTAVAHFFFHVVTWSLFFF
jgi:hypothetical protein